MTWLLLIIVFIGLLYFYPLTFSLKSEGEKRAGHVIKIMWLPLVINERITIPIPLGDKSNKRTTDRNGGKWPDTKGSRALLISLLKKTRIRRLFIKIEAGGSNPALAGLFAGSIGAALGIALAVISTVVRAMPPLPHYKITATFNEDRLSWQLDCIFGFSLGDIIIVFGGLVTRNWRKESKRWLEKLKLNHS